MSIFAERKERIAASTRMTLSRQKMASGSDISQAAGDSMNLFSSTQPASRRRYDMFAGWVFVCIRAVAQRVAKQPIYVGTIKGAAPNPTQRRPNLLIKGGATGKTHKATPAQIRRMPTTIKGATARAQYDIEIYEQHAIIDLMDKPNSVQDKHAFFMQTLINFYLTGFSYWVFGTSSDGVPELWAVPTHWITPKHEGGLFTSYELKVSDMADPVPLEKEFVGRYYMPDPSDLKTAVAPVMTQIKAVTTDDHIQTTQENMFENGLFPAIALKVGKNIGPDGKPMDTRPMLTPLQRRAITNGIKKIWAGTANYNDPAIIDGLIEGIERIQTTPLEMDFTASGEITKKRIFQAFGVNPITVGEITAANRAQAVEAEKSIADGAVNPLIDGLSTVLTNMLGPLFDGGDRLVVWLEEHQPIDAELDLKRWAEARKHNDVTTDEFRAHVLGLGPLEEEVEDDAELVDDDEEELIDDDDDAEEGEDVDEEVDDSDDEGKSRRVTRRKSPAVLSREGVQVLHSDQSARLEGEVTRVLANFFR